jgi:hypothetical protein
MIPFDLYKDIHKAIRVNLFDVTAEAGRLDPSDRPARIGHAARVCDLVDFLLFHADHEDVRIDPAVAAVLPHQSAAINADHVALEATMQDLKALASRAFDEPGDGDARAEVHELYLELARFTSRYLAHQDVEERVVMPALWNAFGLERLLEIHEAIMAAIPPDQLAWGLAKMLPALNVDDRVEVLAGIRAGAPAEAFAGVMALTADVLTEADHDEVASRLGASLVRASSEGVDR